MLLWRAVGAEYKDLSPVGPHYQLLTLDKSENPQNLLAIYTKLKSDCSLASEGVARNPVLGYYWLMDGRTYKRVHPLILMGIRARLKVQSEPHSHSFNVILTDFKELKNDLSDPSIHITTRRQPGGCVAEARMKLGPSDGNEEILLTRIHSEANKTFLPPFRKVTSVTLGGINIITGQPIQRTYSAR